MSALSSNSAAALAANDSSFALRELDELEMTTVAGGYEGSEAGSNDAGGGFASSNDTASCSGLGGGAQGDFSSLDGVGFGCQDAGPMGAMTADIGGPTGYDRG